MRSLTDQYIRAGFGQIILDTVIEPVSKHAGGRADREQNELNRLENKRKREQWHMNTGSIR